MSVLFSGAPLSLADEPIPSSDVTEDSFHGSDTSLFATKLLTKLKKTTTPAQIKKMKDPFLRAVAISMKKGNYDLKNRAKVYTAYESVDDLAKRLKTSTYSRFENPTGIYFESGDNAVVVMEGSGSEKIEFKVHDFTQGGGDDLYPLNEGVNVIPIKNKGLAYISYFTPNFEKAPKIKVHIISGQVNGVFYAGKSTNEDWKQLLASAACEVIDIYGKRVHLVYPVEQLRQSCPEQGEELINLYDQLIGFQHQLMGLPKYKIVPKNRMFGRVIWQGFMHADGMGAAFHKDTMSSIANPSTIPSQAWGISHEFGHVNQTRPGMMWVSTTEVTNNLYSAWANYQLNPTSMRLEHEVINGGDGNMVGGRFNAYLNSAIVNGEQWLCQKGPDKMEGYENVGDHFVKLAPLWQLEMYYMIAKRGNPDLLPDLFEHARQLDTSNMNNGQLQLEFMKTCCDVTKQDLTPFFTKVGMLKPIDKDMDDYSRAQLTITEDQCKSLVQYVKSKKYPKPDSPVIYYISVNSIEAYQKGLPVVGKTGEGVSGDGNTRTISHSDWQNVVAFETYRGKDLIHLAMPGTGSANYESTLVQFPDDATSIKAVSWDGKRTTVYEK
jgi:hypothetical protein